MRDQLLGYLIGGLTDDEHRQVQSHLQNDPELQRQLALLQHSLRPLAAVDEACEPPPGLAQRTCQRVLVKAEVARSVAGSRGGKRRSYSDMLVAAGVFLAASAVFFPAVQQSRHYARVAACQNNLRQVGMSLANYCETQGGFFPYVPPQGHAGGYAPTLVHNRFVTDPRLFICPGSNLAREQTFVVPTLDEVYMGGQPRLQTVKIMGGSYGYSLGYLSNGQYGPQRNLGRSSSPVLSDAPSWIPQRLVSDNHDGSGQNLLYEDGRVGFHSTHLRPRPTGGMDHLFANDQNIMAVGLHSEDSVLGTSDASPLGGGFVLPPRRLRAN